MAQGGEGERERVCVAGRTVVVGASAVGDKPGSESDTVAYRQYSHPVALAELGARLERQKTQAQCAVQERKVVQDEPHFIQKMASR